MDTRLFERCGPKLTLTTEGSILYDLCLPQVQGIERLKETFGAQTSQYLAHRQNGVCPAQCNLEVTLEAGGWEVIKRYVSLGQGISIVTDVCITGDDRTKFKVIPIVRYFPKRSYGIVTRNEKFLSGNDAITFPGTTIDQAPKLFGTYSGQRIFRLYRTAQTHNIGSAISTLDTRTSGYPFLLRVPVSAGR